MSSLKKILTLLLIATLLITQAGTVTVWAQETAEVIENEEEGEELPFEIEAQSAILIESNTGQIMYEKNTDVPYPPASITKIMTLLLALEAIDEGVLDWDEKVTVSENAWKTGHEGSTMFLEVGMEVTVEDILKGISIVSGNDACVAIAEHLYGSENIFVQHMNAKASEIGLTNTRFQNTSGLPEPEHYMSARDIAKLSAYTIETQPKILELESQRKFTFNVEDPQYNRNPLLGHYEGADGLKTGWTREAGYCLAGTAQRDNLRLISVVLNSPDERTRRSDSKALLDYGFRNYVFETVTGKSEVAAQAPVPDGKTKEIDLITAEALEAVIKQEDKDRLEKEIIIDKISAPIREGEKLGKMSITMDDEVLSSVNLLASEDVERSNFVVIAFRRIGSFLGNIATGTLNRIKDFFE